MRSAEALLAGGLPVPPDLPGPLIPKVTDVNPAGTGSDPGIVRQKQTLCLADHDLYMYEQACIVTLCGGAAPRGAPVRAMHAKHAVPPSASGSAAAPPPY